MKRLELRLAFAWELCLRFSCYGRGVAWLILRFGPGSYVPTCIPERPDFSQRVILPPINLVGLLRTDGKRPDGLTLIPWRAGRSLVWDVTVTDTLANSYLPRTSRTAGAAAEMAADRQEAKYTLLAAVHHFVPLAFETMGPVCSAGLVFLSSLGKNLSTVSYLLPFPAASSHDPEVQCGGIPRYILHIRSWR